MKKLHYSLLTLILFFSSLVAIAQEEEEDKSEFSVSLNQDVFFGFYPTIAGTYKLSDGLKLSYYGILWTTPSFSESGTGGGGLWTEFGAGVSLDAGPLTITPQLGILNGKLLSNGNYARFFDGIVPNLTVDLNHDKLEGQFYFGFYKSILAGTLSTYEDDGKTLETASSTNDFIHYWVNGGYKIAPFLSAGIHWEHLYFMAANVDSEVYPDGIDNADLYQWAGAYVEFKHDNAALRFTGGSQVFNPTLDSDVEYGNNTFYKLTASFDF